MEDMMGDTTGDTKDSMMEIITICGPMRFFGTMLEIASKETKLGHIVLMPFVTTPSGDQRASDLEIALDLLHREKIKMSSRVIIVTDFDSYIGMSTARELLFAVLRGKTLEARFSPIRYDDCQ